MVCMADRMPVDNSNSFSAGQKFLRRHLVHTVRVHLLICVTPCLVACLTHFNYRSGHSGLALPCTDGMYTSSSSNACRMYHALHDPEGCL